MNYSVGELFGIGVAAAIARLLFLNIPSESPIPESALTVIILIIAGIAEGFIIGYIQWRSLSKLVPGFNQLLWMFVTIFSTLAGWLFILPPGIMFVAFLSKISLISVSNSVLYTALIGMAFGGMIGIPQFFIIMKYFKNAGVWILSNTLGWMISFLIIYSAILIFQHTTYFIENFLLIVAACILSGLVQGLVMGTSLHFLMSIRKEEDDYAPLWKRRKG
ncbi:MAG TPA: hypothetical protein VGK39_03840 [Cyclobacteriaceae bacterium]